MRHGPIFRFDLGRSRVVCIGEIDTINAILGDRPAGFRRSRELKEGSDETGLSGVFVAEGEEWRRQRRLAVTALNSNHLNRYFHVVRTSTERLHRRLREAARGDGDGGHRRRADLLHRRHHICAGVRPRPEHAGAARQRAPGAHPAGDPDQRTPPGHTRAVLAAESACPRIARRIARWRRSGGRSSSSSSRLARGWSHARSYARRRRTSWRACSPHRRPTGTFSDNEIVGNTFTLLLAGEDTTAHTMAWTMWLLASRPEIQELCAQEGDEVLGGEPFPVAYETCRAPSLRRGRAARVDAAEAGRADRRGRAAGRHEPARHARPVWDAADAADPPRQHARGRLPQAGDFDPERWLANGEDAAAKSDPEDRSWPSEPVRVSARGATSRSWRPRARWR